MSGYTICDIPDLGYSNQCVREQIICAAMSATDAGATGWGFWNDAFSLRRRQTQQRHGAPVDGQR